MTRVLVVIPSLTPEAGAESSMAAVLPWIQGRDIDIHLVLLTPNQGLVPVIEESGIVVHDLSRSSSVQQIRRIRALIETLEPDVVHATLLQASMPTQLAALGRRIPVLLTWANTPTDPRTELAATWKLRLVYFAEAAFAHLPRVRFHAVTEGVALTKARSLRVPPSRVEVAERGRDPQVFHPGDPETAADGRKRLGFGPDDRLLLAVGRQEAQKGYVDLVRAFDAAATSEPSIQLLIAGRAGSATPEIESTIAASHHADRMHLLGHRNDVHELLRLADAVVCASHREGAAGALIEAMGSGVPVLSVELDGMTGVLDDGVNAIVVPRDRLAEGIERLVGDADGARVRADAAHEMFERRFTIQRSAEALLHVYLWAISGARRQRPR